MKKKEMIIKIMLLLLVLVIFAGRAILPEGSLKMYIAPGGLGLILLLVHIFMPQFAGLPKDNPKVKTMRRINLLLGAVMVGVLLVHQFLPESSFGKQDKFLLAFSVAVTLLVGNAAPILQTARIYIDAAGKVPGWRSAVGLHCKFNRRAV